MYIISLHQTADGRAILTKNKNIEHPVRLIFKPSAASELANMTKKIKILLITSNLIGILLLFLLTSIIYAIHTTHAFSMYREFETREIINHKAIEELQKSNPKEKDYDVVKRMQQIGGLKSHLNTMAIIMSSVFIINICILLLSVNNRKKEESHIKIASPDG